MNGETDSTPTGPATDGSAPGKRARTDSGDLDPSDPRTDPRTDRKGGAHASRDPLERPSAPPRGDWSQASFLNAMGLASPLAADHADGPTEPISGNPRDRQDPRTGAPITEHRSPRLADANGAPDAAAQPDVSGFSAYVKTLTSSATPLHFAAPTQVEDASLYAELPFASTPAPPPAGFAQIAVRIGTAEAPLVEAAPSPELFIGDEPRASDVDQNGIGDCYLLAALANVAARDPGHLKAIMKPDGAGGATVTLWRRQAREQSLSERITSLGTGADNHNQYVPVQISVNDELAMNLGNKKLHGAGLQAAKEPSSVDYWAEIHGPTLRVHRKDVYEVARWVALLEKAYARFCERFDQYGGAGPATASTNPASPESGYEGLVGGFAFHSLRVLYGAAADQHGELGITGMTAFPAAGGNILAANPAAVEKLLLLAGKGDRAGARDHTAPILTANTAPSAQVRNLATALAAVTADACYAQLPPDTQMLIAALAASVSVWMATPDDAPSTEGPKARALEAIGDQAALLARTPSATDLAELRSKLPKPVQFDEGSEEVREADKKRLAHFGKWLVYETDHSPCPFELTITGRTSSDGAERKNQGVSERRAANVRDAIFAGNDPAKLARHRYVVTGAGERGAAPGAAWRRVELDVASATPENPLLSLAAAPPLRALMDLVLNLRNVGTDDSRGQRNVYACHAYSVVAVSFKDFAQTEMPLHKVPAAERAGLYGLVDCEASTVKLRNPHHGNEPDRTGANQASRKGDGSPSGDSSDGVFTLSMNEFFRNFNSLDSGVVPRTPDAQ